MSSTYIIQWRSKVNGRSGRGTKVFAHEEAEQLAAELNHQFPDIEHEVAPTGNEAPPTSPAEEARDAKPAEPQPQTPAPQDDASVPAI